MRFTRMNFLGFLTVSLPVIFGGVLAAAPVASSSNNWDSLGINYDYLVDQQTGVPAGDIVGNGVNYGFFTTYNSGVSSTTGELGFRVRLDSAGGPANKPAFDRVLWVGMDADLNGDLDVFMGANFQGNSSELTIRAPGAGTNLSPSTTSISNVSSFSYIPSSINYDYRLVSYLTDGGTLNDMTPATSGDPDYYVSFMMPFADIVNFLLSQGISIDNSTPVRYVMATSTQVNSLNQDLGGVQGGVNSAVTWEQLGGFSPIITPSGTLVPEPEAALLGAVGLILLIGRRRRF